jgi:hypothetical protein
MARAGAQAASEKAAGIISMSAFGGKADIPDSAIGGLLSAYDPFRTLAVPFCCDARDRCLDQ